MALTVETGAGLSNADAYISVVNADAYFTKRGNTTWTDQDTDVKEAAIVRATFGLDTKYRGLWLGVKKLSTQALAWPRTEEKDGETGILDGDGYEISIDSLPVALVMACAEVAYIELTQRYVAETATRDDMIKWERVGPIETEWFHNTPSQTTYPQVEALLRDLTSGTSSGVGMVISLTTEEIEQEKGFDPFDYEEYFNLVKFG